MTDKSDLTTRTEESEDGQLSRRRYLAATGLVASGGIFTGWREQSDGSLTASMFVEPSDESIDREHYTKVELEAKYPGLRVLTASPPNAETERTDSYTGMATGTDVTFIRSHYDTPLLDATEHTVSLTGSIDRTELSIHSLKTEFSVETVAHTMQCAGNGRAYFEPSADGTQWTFGGMGTAFYTGVPVGELLARYGADMSDENYLAVMGRDAPPGEDVYARSIPMSKIKRDCILAYQRNGEPLTTDHGYPVRLVVPGWYGCNSVKWVDRMHVMETMLHGDQWESYTHWQQERYRIVPSGDEIEHHETIETFDTRAQMENPSIKQPYMYDMMTKSLVIRPVDGSTLPARDAIVVLGVALAGEDGVESVEISTDGGATFSDATLAGPDLGPTAWRLFRYEWNPSPGTYTLVSRATDTEGREQPATISDPDEGLRRIEDDSFPWNEKGYGSIAYMPDAVTVTVKRNT